MFGKNELIVLGGKDVLGIRYSCDYCYKDISAVVRIQCAQCGLAPPEEVKEDLSETASEKSSKVGIGSVAAAALEEVDLCVECFGAGVEFGQHVKTHPYRILKPLDFAVYRETWRADEELLLLEAVEANGVGNWNDVAEQLGSRTPHECCQHYIQVYLETPSGPPKALPRDQIEASRTSLQKRHSETKRPKYSTSEEALAAVPTPQSVPAHHEIAGFMPLRGEFETEIENDAELAIKDMVFTDEDTPGERDLKFAMLEIYSSVLERRSARHAFVLDHGLAELKRQQAVDKARSKEERELYNALKPFARFIRVEDFQTLLDGLVREEELRKQIANLQDLRRHGIRAFEEVPAYETERKHLELYLKGGSSLLPSPTTQSMGANVLLIPSSKASHAPIKEPHPLPMPVRRSSTSPVAPLPTVIAIPRGTLGPEIVQSGVSLSASQVPSNSSTPVNANGGIQVNGPSPASQPHSHPHSNPSITMISNSTNNIVVQPMASGGRKASTPLNISHAEGVELLSEKERHLCSILRLYPRLYLSIKDTLIREYLKLSGLKRAQARAAVKIDVNKTSKLYDFFVAAGWIKPPASGE